jgi:predicted enzyme related to lactoylglutathione lyase
MASRPRPTVVVFAADVQRLARFYRAVAGMQVLLEAESHVVLEIDGFELVVHALQGEPMPDGTAPRPVAPREDSYLKLCLPVGTIAEARTVAAAHGGFIQPTIREWDGCDPEGNVLQVREAAGRPGAAETW